MNQIAAKNLLRDFDALLEVVGDMNRTKFAPAVIMDQLDQLLVRFEALRDKRSELVGAKFVNTDEKKSPKVTGIFDHKYTKFMPAAAYGQAYGTNDYRSVTSDAGNSKSQVVSFCRPRLRNSGSQPRSMNRPQVVQQQAVQS
jgi:hypothetical protein